MVDRWLRQWIEALPEAPTGAALHRTCGDCPHLYELDPAHPDVNSLGLRGHEVTVNKPEGTYRILVLGDSVTYGLRVSAKEAFPALLEDSVSTAGHPVEVLNAAVSGYTSWNELEYYLAKGRGFDADLVLVAFVLNDVVNPRLHWAYTETPLPEIPAAAIPDPRYDREVVQPLLHDRGPYEAHLAGSQRQNHGLLRGARQSHLTGEDSLDIEVLLDSDTREWQWLRGIYGRLEKAVHDEGARFAIVWIPLAYQLEPDYPYLPQVLFGEYCRAHGLPCLDLLPALRAHRGERPFWGRVGSVDDIWHLTPDGHAVTAQALEEFLWSEVLLPVAPGKAPLKAAALH